MAADWMGDPYLANLTYPVPGDARKTDVLCIRLTSDLILNLEPFNTAYGEFLRDV